MSVLPTKESSPSSTKPSNSVDHDLIDALYWSLLPWAILSILQIGYVSGDGLVQSIMYGRGTWNLNPNHLLYEPLGALWQHATAFLGIDRIPVDRLRLLSIASGAISAGLVRYALLPQVAPTRRSANYGTAWFVLTAAFLTLWISDETHMIQMPPLVLLAYAAVRFSNLPNVKGALWMGIWGGIATLIYVSNVVIFTFVAAAALMIAHRRRLLSGACVVAVATGFIGVAATGLLIAWQLTGAGGTFSSWVMSYGGGVSSRATDAYGASFTLSGLAESVARAVYGAGTSIVSVSDALAALRDGRRLTFEHMASGAALACALGAVGSAASMTLPRARSRFPRQHSWLPWAWVGGVVAFAVYWNNSDDQFFFQLAVPIAMVTTTIPTARRLSLPLSTLGALALVWNTWSWTTSSILYPRQALSDMLREATRGAQLIIYPGNDEVGRLLHFAQPQGRLLSITGIAESNRPEQGLMHFRAIMSQAAQQQTRVVVINIFDDTDNTHPWKYVRALGYERQEFVEILLQSGTWQNLPDSPVCNRCRPIVISRTVVHEVR